MSESDEKERKALEKLGKFVRDAAKKHAAIKPQELAAIGGAVRQQWEKRQETERANKVRQQEEQKKLQENTQKKDQSKDQGHSH